MQNTNTFPTVLLAEIGEKPSSEVEQCVRKFGWDYTRVSGQQESITAGIEKNYDLIVSDMQLPMQECLNWLRTVKARNPRQAVIVVANTSSVNDALEFFHAGATDLVGKPFNARLFEQVVQRVFNVLQEESAVRQYERFLTYEKRVYRTAMRDVDQSAFKLEILERLLAAKIIDAPASYHFNLAFHEALTNSIEHGNLELESRWKEEIDDAGRDKYAILKKERLSQPKYADRTVTVTVEYDGRSLQVEIEDQGAGFDHDAVRREISEHTRSHGRGLPIMFGVLDEVRYEARGTKVRLKKLLTK